MKKMSELPKEVYGEYDLNDHCLRIFDNYKEIAEAFKTDKRVIQSAVSRIKNGKMKMTFDKELNKWVRIYKVDISYKDENDLKSIALLQL